MYNSVSVPSGRGEGGGGYIMTSNDVHSCKKSSAVYKPSALTSNCAMMSAFVFASTAATTAPEHGGQGRVGGRYICNAERVGQGFVSEVVAIATTLPARRGWLGMGMGTYRGRRGACI